MKDHCASTFSLVAVRGGRGGKDASFFWNLGGTERNGVKEGAVRLAGFVGRTAFFAPLKVPRIRFETFSLADSRRAIAFDSVLLRVGEMYSLKCCLILSKELSASSSLMARLTNQLSLGA